ncbi:hypothetical protein CRUP_007865 [Coryphaenoides rupestris]|nr:hypothetical protein CRUP_007865 [Coryphaenoides rupestris]
MEFGVVYSCIEDKMYSARKGKGAFCDGERLQVSDVTGIIQGDLIRGSGTAATNMCLVASGAVEAFFEIGIHCWDVAAGAVIVTEAGGVLLDVNGGPFDLMSRRMLSANNQTIADRLIREIDVFEAERDDAEKAKK